MRIEFRKAATGIFPWLLFCAVIGWFALSIGVGIYGRKVHDQHITVCLFKNVSGKHCFACGGTRAATALSRGRVDQAFRFNPLMTAVLIASVLCFVLRYPFKRTLSLTADSKGQRIGLWALSISIVLANWYYVLCTLG